MAGCASRVTNLAALHQQRNTNNLYAVEVAFDSRQQTVRWQSIKPRVLVGSQSYEMRTTPLMSNRWEGLIPVPPGQTSAEFRYRIDYQYNRMGKPGTASALSHKYILHILE